MSSEGRRRLSRCNRPFWTSQKSALGPPKSSLTVRGGANVGGDAVVRFVLRELLLLVAKQTYGLAYG